MQSGNTKHSQDTQPIPPTGRLLLAVVTFVLLITTSCSNTTSPPAADNRATNTPEASIQTSTITAGKTTVTSDGIDATTVTIQLRDQDGEPFYGSDGTVTINAPAGEVSNITGRGDGTYTATYKPLGKGDITLTATLDGEPLTDTLTIKRTTTNGFYIHENGVTIKCEDAQPGGTGDIALDGQNAIAYTKRTKAEIDIDTIDPARTCTSGITDMSNMFENKTNFDGDISHWDTSSVDDMSYMFFNADAFNQSIGEWDTSQVENMGSMFFGASAFNQPIGSWDTSQVENMGYMFFGASAFNQPIGDWDTIAVKLMNHMFSGANTFNQPIGNWDTGAVTDMLWMFNNADSFSQDISNWCVSELSSKPLKPVGFDRDTSTEWNQVRKPNWGASCP